jgi:hypothetical protein
MKLEHGKSTHFSQTRKIGYTKGTRHSFFFGVKVLAAIWERMRMRRWGIGIALTLVCGWLLFPVSAQAAYKGWIVDAETHEPVEGVVVFIEFVQSHFLSGRTYVDAAEVLTDERGYFSVPDKSWSVNLWKMLHTDTIMTIFKSGYAPIVGNWNGLVENDGGMPKGTFIWKIDQGKPSILLKRYKSVEEMIQNRRPGPGRIVGPDVSQGSDVESEKWKLLREETNKERNILYPGNNSAKDK